MSMDSAADDRRPPLVRGLQTEGRAPVARCGRCGSPISHEFPGIPLRDLGLCFWCAYVDPQA